ncbi:MAG: hypothetical protein A2089_11450 [Elusimicrobia bacterium GWD2_63_28]|nr:MAG: hypothetical protein A2089_11450 [Elusimicrobia bacterium GWD2_63_28]
MKVLIFTEGGGKSGFGHVTRCLSLYRAFRAAGADAEIVLDGDAAAAGLLRGARHRLMAWRGPRGLAALLGGDIAVVDSYKAPLNFYRQAAARARLLVSLDDCKRLRYPAGLVVNGAVAAARLRYPRAAGVDYLLGARYTPLRPEFKTCPRRAQPAKLRRVLITFGGADTAGLAGRLGEFLRKTTDLRIETPRAGRRLGAAAVKRAMLRADACVTACGQTTYELAACGTPQIGVGFAENQRLNIEGWKALRVMNFAGWKGEAGLFDRIAALLAGLTKAERTAMAARGRAASDGQGAGRVAAAALARAAQPPVFKLRRAALSDSRAIFELSNSPAVRANSINTGKIEWAGHKSWFAAKLKNPGYLFLVAEAGGKFAGQLRYEAEGKEALVSVSIAESFRGRGLAAPLLAAGSRELFAAFPGVKKINAYIRPANKPSARAFEKAGYKFERTILMNKVRLGKYAAKRK